MSHDMSRHVLPATESGLPSATDKAGRFPFSAVSSAVLVVATGLGLVACGGGGGGGASGAGGSSAPANVSVAGQAIKGPVSGGQVCAYTLASPRQQIACTTTDSNANYQLQLPAGTGEVLLEVTGGSYIDEATGKTVALSDPLRTISKGGAANNALITPFTELAVQRATVSNPSGNLSLVGFQNQIGQLEAGLGITGLANGNPFGGKSVSDQNYLEALTAFSKLQAGQGKSVGGTLQIMGTQLDKCGVASLGVTLAAYGTLGPTTTSSGGGVTTQKLAQSLGSQDFTLISGSNSFDTILPSPCTSGVRIDGGAIQPLSILSSTSTPAEWATAKSVEVTQCTGAPQGSWNFPMAKVMVHAESLIFAGNVTLTSLSSYPLDSAIKAIDLNSSGISLNTATGCLQISGVGRANDPFGLSITGASSGGGSLPPGGSISVGNGGGGIIISSGTIGSGGGSVSIGGGGLITNGGTSSSGGGGITVSSKSN
jgi:hypothetical protein